MAGSISRTHDGIPIFDGSPELLPLYKEEAVQYLMTFEYRKRYLAGPRLVKELQGTAKTAVRNMTLRNPQWVSHPRGVFVLLEHLEGIVAKPSLVEASRFIMKYFYGLQRKKFESMTGWVARHSEALWEASQALRKVQREYEPKKASTSERQDWYGQDTNSSRHSRPVSEHGPFRDDGRLDEEEDEGDERGADYEGQWNRRTSWDYGQNWSDWSYQSWHSAEYDPPETWDTSTEVFLPEFLVGFLLLHRSGLDTHERANVLAAIRGQFSPQTVARALREQWSDEDLNKRDRAKFGSALVVDQELEEDLEALMANDDEGDNINVQDLPAEEQEAYMSEQAKIDDALAAIRTQKTTLKEARWKQKQLKLGRGYYPPKPFQKGSSSSGFKKPSGSVGCFKCGGAHMARDCPNKRPDGDAKMAEESAEIAFGAMEMKESLFGSQVTSDVALEAHGVERVLQSCYGIIDSGATSSLGSVDALEEVMKENVAKHGSSNMEIDIQQRPTFRFGNGQQKTCISTVRMGMGAGSKQGTMEVHVHDSPMQPVLISKKALKSLGAVIDFETGQAIYKNIDKHQVVKLKEAENGHLLMPLTGNILSGGQHRERPFHSLLDH